MALTHNNYFKALAILRNSEDVENELQEFLWETKIENDASQEIVSLIGLFKLQETRMAIITAIVLHVTQQFSGINAVRVVQS